MIYQENVKLYGNWDCVVIGGGVAGVTAAIFSKRAGKKTLLIEKSINLGGLATNGLVNYFVPMCDGNGNQIIHGYAEELLKLSYKYSWSDIKEGWKDCVEKGTNKNSAEEGRLDARFSPAIFSLLLAELLQKEGVDILLDTYLSSVIVKEEKVESIIIDSKSGREQITAKMFIDSTGDADLLYRAGVPTVEGKNYYTYYAFGMDRDSVSKANGNGKPFSAIKWYCGGTANLYGKNHPKDKRLYKGTDKKEITEFVLENQHDLFENVKDKDKNGFEITCLPSIPQLRTVRMIDGIEKFDIKNAFTHHEDSIAVINDFDRKDYIYEVPYQTLVSDRIKNVITCGRSASAKLDYSWDVLRVIPPAILTGQAAGNAVSLAIDENVPIYKINVKNLQRVLLSQKCDVHFDEKLLNKNFTGEKTDSERI